MRTLNDEAKEILIFLSFVVGYIIMCMLGILFLFDVI